MRSAAAPAVPFQSRKPHVVEMGFVEFEQGPSESRTSLNSTAPATSFHPSLQCQMDNSSEVPNTSSTERASASSLPTRETMEKLARKRVADSLAEHVPVKKARKRRTCIKCAEPVCPGSQTVKNCQNPCRDCGEKSCRGRNSKKPMTPCHLAWI